ncbi:hypothetical protein WA026_006609 [Henosepilachna vigintioctopunctata]|uniref:Uncharacterized protein n=1 Tax=Henosepilachna vigintioctopunctata TaxID=420089 RepID=A0AAW1UJF9_9CUCU
MSTSKQLTPKLSQAILVIQQGLQERFEDFTTSKNHLTTFLDPQFKMNVFTNQLQKEKVKQYVLIDSIKMSCEETSDDIVSSSPTLTKRMGTEEQSLNQTIHSTFMDCFDEVIPEKITAHRSTSTE